MPHGGELAHLWDLPMGRSDSLIKSDKMRCIVQSIVTWMCFRYHYHSSVHNRERWNSIVCVFRSNLLPRTIHATPPSPGRRQHEGLNTIQYEGLNTIYYAPCYMAAGIASCCRVPLKFQTLKYGYVSIHTSLLVHNCVYWHDRPTVCGSGRAYCRRSPPGYACQARGFDEAGQRGLLLRVRAW